MMFLSLRTDSMMVLRRRRQLIVDSFILTLTLSSDRSAWGFVLVTPLDERRCKADNSSRCDTQHTDTEIALKIAPCIP